MALCCLAMSLNGCQVIKTVEERSSVILVIFLVSGVELKA